MRKPHHSYILFIAFVLFCSLSLQAQNVPGYLGKRFSIGYSVQLSPNFFTGNYSTPGEPSSPGNRSESSFLTGISNIHYLALEYVITKKYSITANFGYSRAYYLPPFEELGYETDFISYDARPGLTAVPIIVGFKMYNEHLAPVGGYFEFTGGYQIVNPDDFTYDGDFSNTNVSGTDPFLPNETITPSTVGSLLVGMKFGFSRVFFDRIKVEYFGTMSLQLLGIGESYTVLGTFIEDGGYFAPNNDPLYYQGNTPALQKLFEEQALGRMFGSHWATTGLSISYLL